MNRINSATLSIVFLVSTVLMLGLTIFIFPAAQPVGALSGNDFNAGRIIDDGVFYNSGTMSTPQIQAFLNAKVPVCDTDGSEPYAGTTRADYGRARGNPPPYTCLKQYEQNTPSIAAASGLCDAVSGGRKSAARIINDVSKACGINPQVLIVLLQKEQSLVTDDWPWPIQYEKATGFGCPDTAPCDPQYEGFFYQIYNAARQFKVYRAEPGRYNYHAGRNNRIYWHPDLSRCGSSTVYIQNQATAGLYIYTPYRPNQAALNNLYGTGNSCSSYGNRNFWRLFSDWFGSTRYPQPVGAELYRQSSTGRIFLVANNKRFYIPSMSIMKNYNLDDYGAIPATNEDISNIPNGGHLTNIVRTSNGNIYLINNGRRHYLPSSSVCANWDLGCFDTSIVRNLGDDFATLHIKSGQTLNNTAYYRGDYYELSEGSRLPFANKDSFLADGHENSKAIRVNTASFSQPLGELQISTPGVIKFSPRNTLYYFDGENYRIIPGLNVYNNWNLANAKSISAPRSSYNDGAAVPATTSLGTWHESSSGEKFLIDNSRRVRLTEAQSQLWPDVEYAQGLDALANKLAVVELGEFVKSGINFYQIVPDLNQKRYISSLSDYRALGGTSSNTLRIDGGITRLINSGPYAFPNGQLIKVAGEPPIYAVNGNGILQIASMSVLRSYRFSTNSMRTFPIAAIEDYEDQGALNVGLLANGSVVIPEGRSLVRLSDSQTIEFGFDKSTAQAIENGLIKNAPTLNASRFWRNSDNGRIYYAGDGALHYIRSIQTYYELGGRSSDLHSVRQNIINSFNIGEPI